MTERPTPTPTPPDTGEPDWLDRLGQFNLHFGRFARDAAGLFLLVVALTSLLALWKLTSGVLISMWSQLLTTAFGWGSYLVIAAIAFFGYGLLRRNLRSWSIGRLVWLELAALLTLGLLSIFGGNSIQRAEAGMDGGQIGWGIARLAWMIATPTGGTLVLLAGWLASIMAGLNIWGLIEKGLLRLAGEARPEPIIEPAIVETKRRTRGASREAAGAEESRAGAAAGIPHLAQGARKEIRETRQCPGTGGGTAFAADPAGRKLGAGG